MIKHLLITVDTDKADPLGGIPLEAPAVEVVRCGECVHFRAPDAKTPSRCTGAMAFIKPTPEHFCAWGERRREDA